MGRFLTAIAFCLVASACGHPPDSSSAARAVPTAPQTPAASAARASAASTKPVPDPAQPLDRYTLVSDASTLRSIAYAFAAPAPNDEQLLTLLPPPTSADAFARHDYLVQHRGELDARLDGARAQRYYRVDVVGIAHPGAAKGAIAWDWSGVQLGGYDFDTHAFPMPCLQTSSLKDEPPTPTASADVVHFALPASGQRCALPVSDVSQAKAAEAARAAAHLSTLPLKASLFFFVTGSRASFPNVIDAVLTHVDVVLLDPKDTASELARSSSDFH